MRLCGFATGVVCFFRFQYIFRSWSSLHEYREPLDSTVSHTWMRQPVLLLTFKSLRVVSLWYTSTHHECSISHRMINEMEASSASLGSPFRPILAPPSAHWHLRDSSSNEGVQIHLEAGQQPTSDIILRPGTVWQNDTGCLTRSHKHTHTPASERRWRKKWEVLGRCESQVRECVYRCLKMCASGVLIGRGRWVRDVRLVVCYVRGRMAGEKDGSVKNRVWEWHRWAAETMMTKGRGKRFEFRGRSWVRGLLEWLNIKLNN